MHCVQQRSAVGNDGDDDDEEEEEEEECHSQACFIRTDGELERVKHCVTQ